MRVHCIRKIIPGLLVVTELIGCGTLGSRNSQLEKIAKDWALVIRASQIIPVYPLTEDIQPGDIFLVQTPIEEQVKIYKKKGFLPLDLLLARLQPANYGAFYSGLYGVGDGKDVPGRWQFPDSSSGAAAWDKSPQAAFPSYNFSVKQGGGMNLALPIQGVPVALSLMKTGSASGSISITDAHTYGIDIQSLESQVEDWAKSNQSFLKNFGPIKKDNKDDKEKVFYLRVVYRVYLAGAVNVSMSNDEAVGAASTAGSASLPTSVDISSHDATTNQANMLAALNASLKSTVIPGGALQVAAASSRSVSMNEKFPRALVVGYLAYDVPILENGALGSPEPTHSRLSQTPVIPAAVTTFQPDANADRIQKWITSDPKNPGLLRQWLISRGYDLSHGITNIINGGGNYPDLRLKIISQFNIP